MGTVELKILDDRITGLDYATRGSAAVDLRACSVEDASFGLEHPHRLTQTVTMMPGDKALIGTGVAVHLGSMDDEFGVCLSEDEAYTVAGLILPRSGLARRGIRLANQIGLCDSDYLGQIMLALENTSNDPFIINPLDRMAQYMVVPVLQPTYVVVPEFSQTTERGTGGFGSTGR